MPNKVHVPDIDCSWVLYLGKIHISFQELGSEAFMDCCGLLAKWLRVRVRVQA